MNIILIPKSRKHKRSVQISAAKASLWLVPSMAVMSGLLVWLGYVMGSGVQPSVVDRPVEAWVETLRKSQRAVAELRDDLWPESQMLFSGLPYQLQQGGLKQRIY